MAKAQDWTLTIKLDRGVKRSANRKWKVSLVDARTYAQNILASGLARVSADARVQLDWDIDGQRY